MREEFLRLAKRAEELANAISQPHARERMLAIADQWRDMAQEADPPPRQARVTSRSTTRS